MAKAIKKYGSNNFRVELLEFCIDKSTLDKRERYYIEKYHSTDINIGYNIAIGGQGGNLGEKVNKKISAKLKGIPTTEATKIKISETLKNKQLKLTDEHKKIISEANKGKILSEETKKKISETRHSRVYHYVAHNKNKIFINNGKEATYIYPDEEIPEGWVRGMGKTKPHDMSNYYKEENIYKRKLNSISKSGMNNSMYGNGYKISGGKNGKATLDYYFDGLYFECRKYLVEYLRKNIDSTVTEGAIRSIVNGTYGNRISKRYDYIIERLSWELKK